MSRPGVLLINPRTPSMTYPRAYPPIGLFYVARVLADSGIEEVHLVDENVTPHYDVGTFACCMISVNIVQVTRAREIIARIRRSAPDTFIVVGGPMAPYLRQELGSLGEDLLFIGEAEGGLVEALQLRVLGVFVANHISVIRQALAPDTLPFANYSAVDQGHRSASYVVSRGCPYRCSFCSEGVVRVGRREVRYVDLTALEADLIKFRELGYRHLRLWDDIFGIERATAKPMLEAFERHGFTFDCQLRSNMITRDWLTTLASHGCTLIRLGFESFSDTILLNVEKSTTVARHLAAIRTCRQANMPVRALLILGLPGETERTVNETFGIVEEYQLSATLAIFCPYPGAPVWERPDAFDISFDKTEILTASQEVYYSRREGTARSFVSTSALSRDQIEQYFFEFERRFSHLMKPEGSAEVVRA